MSSFLSSIPYLKRRCSEPSQKPIPVKSMVKLFKNSSLSLRINQIDNKIRKENDKGRIYKSKKYVKNKKEKEEMVRQIGILMVWFVESNIILLNYQSGSIQFIYYMSES